MKLISGQPRRHLLQSGWSVFVSSKRLVAGDAFIFLRFVESVNWVLDFTGFVPFGILFYTGLILELPEVRMGNFEWVSGVP